MTLDGSLSDTNERKWLITCRWPAGEEAGSGRSQTQYCILSWRARRVHPDAPASAESLSSAHRPDKALLESSSPTRPNTTCRSTQHSYCLLTPCPNYTRRDRINQISQPIRRMCGRSLPGSALLSPQPIRRVCGRSLPGSALLSPQPIRRVCGRSLPGSALLSQWNEYVYNLIHKY